MRAAWYERRGDAATVLTIGGTDAPAPDDGEVRIRVRSSGVNPGDVKKRSGYFDSAMPFHAVIPYGDGAGIIDAVGPGVSSERIARTPPRRPATSCSEQACRRCDRVAHRTADRRQTRRGLLSIGRVGARPDPHRVIH